MTSASGREAGERVDELLAKAGLRHTRQRREILQLLLEKHGPFSAQDVMREIGERSCDPVTVYRVLETLAAARLARRCDFSDGIARFEGAVG